jgi:hypothetical protein
MQTKLAQHVAPVGFWGMFIAAKHKHSKKEW